MSFLPSRSRQRQLPRVLSAATALLAAVIAFTTAASAAGASPQHPVSPFSSATCTPSPEHPRPVILVHGTWVNRDSTWSAMASALRNAGYCVYALDYGQRQQGKGKLQNLFNMFGGDAIESSARTLATYVETVRRETGANQVDMVGHSQGALVIRQYLKFNGGTDIHNPANNKVHTVVSLAGTNHGSTFNSNQAIGAIAQALGIPVIKLASLAVGPSYIEQMVGSPFLQKLNAGGDTRPGVNYVAIGSHTDGIVTPPERTLLTAGPGATVRNVWIQDGCPGSTTAHMKMTTDPEAINLVMGALDPRVPRTPHCR